MQPVVRFAVDYRQLAGRAHEERLCSCIHETAEQQLHSRTTSQIRANEGSEPRLKLGPGVTERRVGTWQDEAVVELEG